jgi:acylglycerol lipase
MFLNFSSGTRMQKAPALVSSPPVQDSVDSPSKHSKQADLEEYVDPPSMHSRQPDAEEYVETPSKHSLLLQTWRPECSPKGLVVLVHGYGEHLGRWGHVADFFTEDGYVVIGADHAFHGRSKPGAPFVAAYSDNQDLPSEFDFLIEDHIHLIAHRVKSECPDLPHYVYAHSSGGLIMFHALRRLLCEAEGQGWPNFRGIVFSAPCLHHGPAKNLRRSIVCLPRNGTLSARKPGRMARLAKNTEVQKNTSDDALYFGWNINVGFLAEFMRSAKDARGDFASVEYPFMILHSPNDKLSSVRGSSSLYRDARSTDKELHTSPFKGCGHELHNEEDWQLPLRMATAWYAARGI